MKNTKKYLEYFLFTTIVLIFLTPLIFVPGSFIFPFIVPKILFFRSMVLLLLGIYLSLIFIDRKTYLPRKTPINIAISLYIVSFTISTFLGVDWYKSLWDSHERMLGLFTIFHYFLFYIVCTSAIRKWKSWEWLFSFFLISGSIVMAIGILQKINPELLANRGSDRVSATLGNSIYFGAYGGFLFFVSLLLYLKKRSVIKLWNTILLILSSCLGLIGVFISGTRGVLVGLIAGYIVLLCAYLLILKGHKKIKLLVYVAIILSFLSIVTLFSFRHTQFVQKIPIVGRLLNQNIFSGTGGTRLMAWGVALDGWKERPIFGWGPNNYYYAFNKYYRPEFLRHGPSETWFDNAHNATLNTLTVQGLFGFVFYLGLFLVPIYVLFVLAIKKKISVHIFTISSAFLAFHVVQQFFVFENPTSYLYLFFFLAFINAEYQQTGKIITSTDKINTNKQISTGILSIIFISIFVLIYSTNINSARANNATMDVLRNIYQNKDGLTAYEKAISIATPHVDDIRMDFARSLISSFQLYIKAGEKEKIIKLFDIVYIELKKNKKLHPADIRTHLQQVQLYQMVASVNNNFELLIEARDILREAIQISPKRQQLYYSLAGLEMQLNNPNGSISALDTTIHLDPSIQEGWWRKVLIYKYLNMPEKAKKTVEDALISGIVFSGEGEKAVQDFLPHESEADNNKS